MANRKQNILFIVCAYGFFWLFLVLTIGTLLSLGMEEFLAKIMPFGVVIGSWTPTFALFFLFKKLYPGWSIKEFYENAFKERLNWKMMFFVAFVQLIIIIGASGIVALTREVSLLSLFDLSFKTLGMGFVWTLFQGATGEESGWRGFLQLSMEKMYSVIKSSVFVGIIWAFWHTPLWFLSGYTGNILVQYILSHIPFCISISIIIGICYSRCRNLIIPVWIHFFANYFLIPFNIEYGDFGDVINIFTWATLFYIFTAVCYIVWYKKSNVKINV
ncbi:MAG: CPBP family intramembrane metalloprotease [Treponema sp.]|jgi:membrane protease YdiL (CAAX protease family)|nr:CPBP family intramembrane metalloprotease [Treponema sp.]